MYEVLLIDNSIGSSKLSVPSGLLKPLSVGQCVRIVSEHAKTNSKVSKA